MDPYLTDSVAEQFGPALRRLVPPTLAAAEIAGVSWILLTHAHLDHADPASLRALRPGSPGARFLAPAECEPILREAGIAPEAVTRATEGWHGLAPGLRVLVVPAAHPRLERDAAGAPRYVGYLLAFEGGPQVFHAGDTLPHPELLAALAGQRIDYAFLPINERNYFKDESGIVGNMTPREAFGLAERLGARALVPTHWDLFAPNRTFPWEIERLHEALRPPFALRFLPCGSAHELA